MHGIIVPMIRRATIDDYAAITYLKKTLAVDVTQLENPEYRIATQKRGFLVTKDQSIEAFSKDVEKMSFVYEEGGTVVGYIRIDEEPEMRKETNAYWFKPSMEKIYFSLPHAATGGIAVLPNAAQKGIGSQLLHAAENEVKAKGIPYLFAFVVISPLTNIASILFHERNGYQRFASNTMPEMFGMKNFQSFLYGKKL